MPSARTIGPRPAEPAAALLSWFDRVKRPLPWRLDRDPYRVWVSEAMLQQTRVETAIPYFERFLLSLPSVEALARADEAQVRALWSGLGYYRRARMLHEASRRIVADGRFPKTARDWQLLPGVGPYTAAAVASIAFGEKVAAVDGNVERVLARLEAYGENPKSAAGRRFMARAAESWLNDGRPGDCNQALMELGATVCLPSQPRCESCPIVAMCRARRFQKVDAYPYRPPSSAKRDVRLIAVCVRRGGRLLLFRRGAGEQLLAGTWEIPWVRAGEPNLEMALTRTYGGIWGIGRHLATIRHSITTRKISVSAHQGTFDGDGKLEQGTQAAWANHVELERLPHSSLVRKLFLAAV